MNLFENTLRLNGFPIDEAKEKLKSIEQIPENEYRNYIYKAREAIVQYHIQNNSFYRSFIGNEKLAWEEIPVMTKKHLQQPLENRLSKKFEKKSIYINKTSGSSGTPFIFAKDKFCHALSWAEIINRFASLEINFNTSLQARFYGIPLNFQGYFKERIKDFFSHRYRFSIFDLSEIKLEKILNSFKRKKYDYINGYTSSIVLFAKFLKDRDILLTEVCPTLKYCIVTSEMLFDDDKDLLEKQLGVPVFNEYGSAEVGVIALTSLNEEWEVDSKTLFIEILDKQGKSLPLGREGRIVITSLYNKAHPIIRYEIGDFGVLSKKSTYKNPILEKLIGRTNDIATLPSGKTVPGLTFYYVTKNIISNDGNVKEFIIEQTKLDTFKIQYVAEKQLTKQEKLKVQKSIFEYLEKDLKLTFERTNVLKRSKSGKLKQFVSLVNP